MGIIYLEGHENYTRITLNLDIVAHLFKPWLEYLYDLYLKFDLNLLSEVLVKS